MVVRIAESFGKENGEKLDTIVFALFDGISEFFGEDEGAFLSEVFGLSFEEQSLGFGLGVFGRSELPDDACDGFSTGIAICVGDKTTNGEDTGAAAVGIGEGAESGVVELDDACLIRDCRGG